jgi:subtilisin family serine protease
MGIAATRADGAIPLGQVGLDRLMAMTSGRPEIVIGLIDGPIALDHPGFDSGRIRLMAGPGHVRPAGSPTAASHGTFVAGVLVGRRGGAAPGICPGCSLLSRHVFADDVNGDVRATPGALAAAIEECVEAGARILNVSAALTPSAAAGSPALTSALDRAARRGTLIVVAAGNDGIVGGSALTRHPWVVPVAACTTAGRPSAYSSFGLGIGKRGLSAPGDRITSLAPPDGAATWSGTSAATPFVTGAAALLWSAVPAASVDTLRHALLSTGQGPRTTVVPPRLDAWAAYTALLGARA